MHTVWKIRAKFLCSLSMANDNGIKKLLNSNCPTQIWRHYSNNSTLPALSNAFSSDCSEPLIPGNSLKIISFLFRIALLRSHVFFFISRSNDHFFSMAPLLLFFGLNPSETHRNSREFVLFMALSLLLPLLTRPSSGKSRRFNVTSTRAPLKTLTDCLALWEKPTIWRFTMLFFYYRRQLGWARPIFSYSFFTLSNFLIALH